MDDEERCHTVRRLLIPGGEPFGRPGRSRTGTIRVLSGGAETAQKLFARFEEIGETEEIPGYPGQAVGFDKGERVGLRLHSRSGEPTIDVTISYIPEIEKLKFE